LTLETLAFAFAGIRPKEYLQQFRVPTPINEVTFKPGASPVSIILFWFHRYERGFDISDLPATAAQCAKAVAAQ
jgi:hypothetical protein